MHTVEIGRDVYVIEKMAHHEMGAVHRDGEWFEASAEDCIGAVERALRLHQDIGSDGWQKRRQAAWRNRRKPSVKGGKKGAPGMAFSNEQIEAWRKIWLSDEHPTNAAAIAAMGKPFRSGKAFLLFGPSGRPAGGLAKMFTADQQRKAQQMLDDGVTLRAAAVALGVSMTTIQKYANTRSRKRREKI